MPARAKYTANATKLLGEAVAVVPHAAVTVLEPSTSTPLVAPIYAGATGGATRPNPFTVGSDGMIEFYLEFPQRVKLSISGAGFGPAEIDNEPVLPDPAEILTVSVGITGENVMNYGAGGSGATNDTQAFLDAHAALPSGGGRIYAPYVHRVNDLDLSGKVIEIVGDSRQTSALIPNTTTGSLLSYNGAGGGNFFALRNISLQATAARHRDSWVLDVRNCYSPVLEDVYADIRGGGILKFTGCTNVQMDRVIGRSLDLDGLSGDGCLLVDACSGHFSGLQFQSGQGTNGLDNGIARAPVIWLKGGVNTYRWEGCIAGGYGTRKVHNISSVSSTPTHVTAVTQTAHDFIVGDLVVVRAFTDAAGVTGVWRVTAVNLAAQSVTFLCAGNPGSQSAPGTGTISNHAAGWLVTGEGQSTNESTWIGCYATNVVAAPHGTAGFHIDGKHSPYELNMLEFTGGIYDGGSTGILVSGRSLGASLSVYGININGYEGSQVTRYVHVDWAGGVKVSNAHMGLTGPAPSVADGLTPACGAYVYAGASAPYAQGIEFNDCDLGMPRDMGSWGSSHLMPYGLLVEGPVPTLTLKGGVLGGSTAPVGTVNINAAALADLFWDIDPSLTTNALPVTAASRRPTVVAATSITLPIGYSVVKISGTTNIQTINGGTDGREVTLLFSNPLSLVTGGNAASVANRPVLAGDALRLVFDGGSGFWFAR